MHPSDNIKRPAFALQPSPACFVHENVFVISANTGGDNKQRRGNNAEVIDSAAINSMLFRNLVSLYRVTSVAENSQGRETGDIA